MRGLILALALCAAAAAVALTLATVAVGLFHGYFWHPLHGDGYQFWSGIAGSFLTSLPGWLFGLGVFLYARNCHVKGCWRLNWHEHPDHGHPVCRKHHPHSDSVTEDGL